MKSRPSMFIALVFTLSASIFAQAISLGSLGFDATIPEIMLLMQINGAVRYDSAAKIDADWQGSYDRIAVVDIPSVENRYGLLENGALCRADIAIRGTVNAKNATFDLKFLKDRSQNLGIFLHSGFERVAMAVCADLLPRLKKDYAYRITGHSLGAAKRSSRAEKSCSGWTGIN